MLFDFSFIIPAHTLQSAPFEGLAGLTRGRLTQIIMLFPPGPATLVHMAVRHSLHQLMPANYDGDINFDDAIITSVLDYKLVDPPYEIRVLGWSEDAVYDHNITVQFNVEPNENEDWDAFNHTLFLLNNRTRDR